MTEILEIPTKKSENPNDVRSTLKRGLAKLHKKGIKVNFTHANNPIAEIPEGMSGHGQREVEMNIFFDKGETEPRYGSGTDSVISARLSHGWTVCEVTLRKDALTSNIPPTETVYVGHAICSANDNYNGNVGALISLSRALKSAKIDSRHFFNQ